MYKVYNIPYIFWEKLGKKCAQIIVKIANSFPRYLFKNTILFATFVKPSFFTSYINKLCHFFSTIKNTLSIDMILLISTSSTGLLL